MRKRIRKNTSITTVQLEDGSIENIIHEADMSIRKVTRDHTIIEPKKETISTTSKVTKKKSFGRVLLFGGCGALFGALLNVCINNINNFNKNNNEQKNHNKQNK